MGKRRKRVLLTTTTTTTKTTTMGLLFGTTRELGTLVLELGLLPGRKGQVADVVKETVVAVQKVDGRLLALQAVTKGVLRKRERKPNKKL